ncbi:glycoside hydrolase [Haematococcus lacustris]
MSRMGSSKVSPPTQLWFKRPQELECLKYRMTSSMTACDRHRMSPPGASAQASVTICWGWRQGQMVWARWCQQRKGGSTSRRPLQTAGGRTSALLRRQHAWGRDELVGRGEARDWLHLKSTIIDSLDTLKLMGLQTQYKRGLDHVLMHLDLYALPFHEVSVFETTIRILGGLLSAFHLSRDVGLLTKAVQLGEMLMPAFNTSLGVALPNLMIPKDLPAMQGVKQGGSTVIAAVGTLSLEFSTLSHLTGRPEFEAAAMQFWQLLNEMGTFDGLFCESLNVEAMACHTPHMGLGSPSDSFYEVTWTLTLTLTLTLIYTPCI